MLPPDLNNAVIALLQQDGNVFLGWEYGIAAESVNGYISGQLFRVLDYNANDCILYLKPEGNASSEAYRLTFDKYGSIFAAMGIKRIEISRARMLGIKQITLATGYTQPVKSAPQYQAPPPLQPSVPPKSPPKNAPPSNPRFTETCNLDIRDAIFDDGVIRFTVKVKFAWVNVEVVLQNASVKQYFDSVKNYIWKLFGSKKTPCTITFEIQNGKCVPFSIDSCDLKNLDETILQNIHNGWVDQVILSSDRNEITALDDLIDPIKDENHNGETVFNHIVQESKTKHYHHLRYLSARQAIDLQKLSITGKPLSFIFVIRNNENVFLVWETYLTQEATYVWKLTDASDIVQKFGLIQEIRKTKRMVYRRKKEDGFTFIEHDYLQPTNGFLKWKTEIENLIV